MYILSQLWTWQYTRTDQSVDGPTDEVKTLDPEHYILPLGVEHDAGLGLTPWQVVVMGTIVDWVSGLGSGGGRQSRASKLVAVLTCVEET